MNIRPPMTLVLVAVAACNTAGANRALNEPKVDTLPGGVVRVANSGPTRWADTNGWKLVLERTIAPPDNTPGQLNRPNGIVVDSRGRIFLLDQKPTLIKVYAADGTFSGVIGREGSGPGEFRQWGILFITHDTLMHHDPGQSRTQSFTTEGAFIKAWTSLCCWQMPTAADDSGRAPVPGNVHIDTTSRSFMAGAGYIRYRPDGSVADTIVLPPRPEMKSWVVLDKGKPTMTMSVPLMPGTQGTFDRAGHYVWGHQDRYQIVVSRRGTDTVRLFSSSAPSFPIPDSVRQERFDQVVKGNPQIQAIAKFDDIPRNYPAWTSLTCDGNGNYWVIRPGPRSDGDLFDVFTPEGVLLGSVPAPFHNIYRTYWTRDRVYTIQEDDASGVQAIKVYRIDRTGGK